MTNLHPSKQTLTVAIHNKDRNVTVNAFDIPQNEKVQDATSRAAAALGFPPSPNYRLLFGETPLEPQRPVGSYKEIEDGVTLFLVDIGGGV